ncbi:MAG: AAA family ATPase [Prochlorothrix sp.]|nr:AAA family ATPase [Prochlorothrix sp.]
MVRSTASPAPNRSTPGPNLSLGEVLRRELNPFDPRTFKPGNFWLDRPDTRLNITSIHQEVLGDVETYLGAVTADGVARTLLLLGESGAGKSHLLGQLQQRLNEEAFFVYIGPWPDSQYIWRHILRNTVDSLLEIPEGQDESQLQQWVAGLLALQDRDFSRRLFGQRRIFVRKLVAEYAKGMYNPHEFFGVLYDLTDPDLSDLAASWLRGDNLDQESCEDLRVRQPIDSEDAAQKILGNFGNIAAVTRPIVLCFDNLDNLPHLPSGQPDFQSLFNVNSSIHNAKLRHFLLIISVVTHTWKLNAPLVQPADLARIDAELSLKPIDLTQAQAIWANRLAPYHAQATPTPPSPLDPLGLGWLEEAFPSGRTLPRNVLVLGQQLIERLKQQGKLPLPQQPEAVVQGRHPDLHGEFSLVWHHELRKTQHQLQRPTQLSSPELVWRLRELLEALGLEAVEIPFLERTKFAAYSLSYRQAPRPSIAVSADSLTADPVSSSTARVALIWVEDPNLNTFFHVMKACQKNLEMSPCDRVYLLRSASLGHGSSKGNQLFHLMFSDAHTHHLKPDLASIQVLETYHKLVNAVCGRELVLGTHTPDLTQLQALVRGTGVLQSCTLLQGLGVVSAATPEPMADASDRPASHPGSGPNSDLDSGPSSGLHSGSNPSSNSDPNLAASSAPPIDPPSDPPIDPNLSVGAGSGPALNPGFTSGFTSGPTPDRNAPATMSPTGDRAPSFSHPAQTWPAQNGKNQTEETQTRRAQAPNPADPPSTPADLSWDPDLAAEEDETGFLTPALLTEAQAYLHNLLISQKLMGVTALIAQGHREFPTIPSAKLYQIVKQLHRLGAIQLLNPTAPKEEQLASWSAGSTPTPRP